MARYYTRNFAHFDTPEFSPGPGFDLETMDDTDDDAIFEDGTGWTARQCIEMREEAEWLRSQMVDWDDWDEYFETH